jgi:hypothetical protein
MEVTNRKYIKKSKRELIQEDDHDKDNIPFAKYTFNKKSKERRPEDRAPKMKDISRRRSLLEQLVDYKHKNFHSHESSLSTGSVSSSVSFYPSPSDASISEGTNGPWPLQSRRSSYGYLSRTTSMDSNSGYTSPQVSSTPTKPEPNLFGETAAEDVLMNLGFCSTGSFLPERFARDWASKIKQAQQEKLVQIQQQHVLALLEDRSDETKRPHHSYSNHAQQNSHSHNSQSYRSCHERHKATDFVHALDVQSRQQSYRRRDKFQRSATILSFHQNSKESSIGNKLQPPQEGSMEKQDSIDQLKAILEKQASLLHVGSDKQSRRQQFATSRQKSLPLFLETLCEEDEAMKSFEQRRSQSRGSGDDRSSDTSSLQSDISRFNEIVLNNPSPESASDKGCSNAKNSSKYIQVGNKDHLDNDSEPGDSEIESITSKGRKMPYLPSVPSIIVTAKTPPMVEQSSCSLEVADILEPAMHSTVLPDSDGAHAYAQNKTFDTLSVSPLSPISLSPSPLSPITVIECELDNQNDSFDDIVNHPNNSSDIQRRASDSNFIALSKSAIMQKCSNFEGSNLRKRSSIPNVLSIDTIYEDTYKEKEPIDSAGTFIGQFQDLAPIPTIKITSSEISVQADDGSLTPIQPWCDFDDFVLGNQDLCIVTDNYTQCITNEIYVSPGTETMDFMCCSVGTEPMEFQTNSVGTEPIDFETHSVEIQVDPHNAWGPGLPIFEKVDNFSQTDPHHMITTGTCTEPPEAAAYNYIASLPWLPHYSPELGLEVSCHQLRVDGSELAAAHQDSSKAIAETSVVGSLCTSCQGELVVTDQIAPTLAGVAVTFSQAAPDLSVSTGSEGKENALNKTIERILRKTKRLKGRNRLDSLRSENSFSSFLTGYSWDVIPVVDEICDNIESDSSVDKTYFHKKSDSLDTDLGNYSRNISECGASGSFSDDLLVHDNSGNTFTFSDGSPTFHSEIASPGTSETRVISNIDSLATDPALAVVNRFALFEQLANNYRENQFKVKMEGNAVVKTSVQQKDVMKAIDKSRQSSSASSECSLTSKIARSERRNSLKKMHGRRVEDTASSSVESTAKIHPNLARRRSSLLRQACIQLDIDHSPSEDHDSPGSKGKSKSEKEIGPLGIALSKGKRAGVKALSPFHSPDTSFEKHGSGKNRLQISSESLEDSDTRAKIVTGLFEDIAKGKLRSTRSEILQDIASDYKSMEMGNMSLEQLIAMYDNKKLKDVDAELENILMGFTTSGESVDLKDDNHGAESGEMSPTEEEWDFLRKIRRHSSEEEEEEDVCPPNQERRESKSFADIFSTTVDEDSADEVIEYELPADHGADDIVINKSPTWKDNVNELLQKSLVSPAARAKKYGYRMASYSVDDSGGLQRLASVSEEAALDTSLLRQKFAETRKMDEEDEEEDDDDDDDDDIMEEEEPEVMGSKRMSVTEKLIMQQISFLKTMGDTQNTDSTCDDDFNKSHDDDFGPHEDDFDAHAEFGRSQDEDYEKSQNDTGNDGGDDGPLTSITEKLSVFETGGIFDFKNQGQQESVCSWNSDSVRQDSGDVDRLSDTPSPVHDQTR